MANWNEADHPRDDIGRFTDKGGSFSKSTNEENIQNREDILYPTMKDKTEEKYIGSATPLLKGGVEKQVQPKQRHELKNEIAVDHIDNKILEWYASKTFGLETAENLLMSKKKKYIFKY